MLPEHLVRNFGVVEFFQFIEEMRRFDDVEQGLGSDNPDRMVDVLDLFWKIKKRTVDDADDACSQGYVLRNDLADGSGSGVVVLQFPYEALIHGGTAWDRFYICDNILDFGAQDDVVGTQSVADRGNEVLRLAGFTQVLVGQLDVIDNCFLVRISREDDLADIGFALLDVSKDVGAIHVRHAHVRDHYIGPEPVKHVESFGAAGRETHVPLILHGAQAQPEAFQNVLMIVDKQNLCFHLNRPFKVFARLRCRASFRHICRLLRQHAVNTLVALSRRNGQDVSFIIDCLITP